jgi:uroporphyrinogen-III synthase
VLTVAEKIGVLDEFRAAVADRTLVASIGPTCSEALTDNGFPAHTEASPPKMAQLIRATLDALRLRTT